MLAVILLLIAAVCFGIEAWRGRSIIALGLLAWGARPTTAEAALMGD